MDKATMGPRITAVHLSAKHSFSKATQPEITLLTGEGVQGDAHCGVLVKHRYMVRKDPTKPNLCQVHLLQHELLDELGLQPGELGENITTRGFDLLTLPTGTRLEMGDAMLEVTGLRSPCSQINGLRAGLMKECFIPKSKAPRAGIMAIVIHGGTVRPDDAIRVTLPQEPHRPLVCV
ncbi:MOSC domain-containing protein [soil metagenome]